MATAADILEMRRNPQMMTSDGFSPDRLSYSVANDFGKLWGDAMANYEARLNNPKYLPGSFNPNLVQQPPDQTPQQLQAEYLNPVLERFGGRPAGGSAKTYHVGNSLVEVGAGSSPNVIYTEKKAPEEMTKKDTLRLQDAMRTKAALLGKLVPSPGDSTRLKSADDTIGEFFAPKLVGTNAPGAATVLPGARGAGLTVHPNVTEAEHSSLKPGETYWWNGKQYTKK